MRAHVANGNPAEALLVYGRLRVLLADELGVDPSAETERLHLDVLRSSAG
jgi:DNA-binding SARP family transcriptional activator